MIISHKKLKSTGVEIGRGAYGRVFEVEYEKTRYAAKEVHSLLLEDAQGKVLENIKASFLHECHIWSLLQHPRIIEIIGLSQSILMTMYKIIKFNGNLHIPSNSLIPNHRDSRSGYFTQLQTRTDS